LAFISLGSLLIFIGCGSSQSSDVTSAMSVEKGSQSAKETSAEKAYRERFVAISAELEAVPKPEQGSDPEIFLTTLKDSHEKERTIIESLGEIEAPPKYKEFHKTLVEWKRERWALDEEGISYLSDKELEKVDELSNRIDQVGESYTKRIDEIVKSHGYNSTEKFLGIN